MVIGERYAKAVEDATARGCQEAQTDAVLVREHRVAVGFQDLKLIHAPSEGGDEQCLADGEDGHAPAEELLTLPFRWHRRPDSL